MELAILIGIQAAGKTSFAERTFAATHVYVSKDRLAHTRNAGRRQRALVEEALAAGHSVVIDNTNPTPADRADLIRLGHTYGACIQGYYFPPDIAASRQRNAERSGPARVPEVAIFATARRLIPPTFEEGFDRLSTVTLLPEGHAVLPWPLPGGDADPPSPP